MQLPVILSGTRWEWIDEKIEGGKKGLVSYPLTFVVHGGMRLPAACYEAYPSKIYFWLLN